MDVTIQFGSFENSDKIVRNKGKSIIEIPNKYVVIDTETTGLNPRYDNLLEIAAIKIDDGKIIDKFNCLISQDDDNSIPEYITNLTGISNSLIKSEGVPKTQAIKDFSDFVSDSVVVGYNTSFDINFIYDLQKEINNTDFSNNYIDVMRFARRIVPELKHHRLSDMLKYFAIEEIQEHRSLSDC